MIVVLCLLSGLMVAEGRAEEFNLSQEEMTAINAALRESGQLQGDDRVARQEAAFHELLTRHADNPDAQWWIYRTYWDISAHHAPTGNAAATAAAMPSGPS